MHSRAILHFNTAMSLIKPIGFITSRQWNKQVVKSLTNNISIFKSIRRYSTNRTDYYALFPNTFPSGLTPFAIDPKNLRLEFIQKQAQIHPDKAASSNASRQELETESSLLNTAYQTLTNPLRRAEHLLEQQGIEALAEKESLVDEDLLMDVLMTREAISVLSSTEEWREIKQENDAKITASEKVLENAFKRQDYEAAKLETIQLSYWMNIDHHLKEMEGNLE